MSTRCNIEFYDDYMHEGVRHRKLSARLYQHSDGCPDNIIPLLRKLQRLMSSGEQVRSIFGPRVNDPEWCAAEFISLYRESGRGNIYVSQQRHGDIEYLYKVYCQDTGFRIDIFLPGDKRLTNVTGKYNRGTGRETTPHSKVS